MTFNKVFFFILTLLVTAIWGWERSHSAHGGHHRPITLVSPARGEVVSALRPRFEVSVPQDWDAWVTIWSPDPGFHSKNAQVWISVRPGFPVASLGLGAMPPELPPIQTLWNRLSQIERYSEKDLFGFRAPYNLNALVLQPYGYRIVGCRPWLRWFAGKIADGWNEPIEALHTYSAFRIRNEGVSADYMTAYQILAANRGVCGHFAELMAALSRAAGYESRILGISGTSGHIVAEVRDHERSWISDPTYHFLQITSATRALARVEHDPGFWAEPPYFEAAFRYRDLWRAFHPALSIQTSAEGVLYSREENSRTSGFSDALAPAKCPRDMGFDPKQPDKVLRNLFFTASYVLRGGKWSAPSYSWFLHEPKLEPGQMYLDRFRDIWGGDVRNVPAQFLEASKAE